MFGYPSGIRGAFLAESSPHGMDKVRMGNSLSPLRASLARLGWLEMVGNKFVFGGSSQPVRTGVDCDASPPWGINLDVGKSILAVFNLVLYHPALFAYGL